MACYPLDACTPCRPRERKIQHRARWACAALVPPYLALMLLAGCNEVEQITSYRIPKPKAVAASKSGEKSRMLGAIVPQGPQTWFFKLMGPVDSVTPLIEPFMKFVGTVRFHGGTPAWTVPEGWRERGGSDMRFATLEIGGEKSPLELTVTKLGSDQEHPRESMLANVNRWRGQLQLPPITLEELDAETTPLPLEGGATATIVNISGQASAGGMGPGGMRAPFAGGGPAPAVPPAEAAASSDLKYDTPASWKQVKRGSMSVATFDLPAENGKGEVTVTPLSIEGGDPLQNVNRWRGQVKLPVIDAAELKKQLKPIAVGELKGDYVELVGTGKDGKPETILGVIVKSDDTAWFIKLRGPAALAAQEKTHFEEFVHSLKFDTK